MKALRWSNDLRKAGHVVAELAVVAMQPAAMHVDSAAEQAVVVVEVGARADQLGTFSQGNRAALLIGTVIVDWTMIADE